MIIYNVTSKVDWSIAEAWLSWMLNEHLPEVLNTGYFHKHQIAKLIDIDENDGPTYTIQYYTDDIEKYNQYITNHATILRTKAQERWGNQFASFRTLMEVVN
jgi:hypothetical protein